jgi:D-alanyl-D-alanine dipeptidase
MSTPMDIQARIERSKSTERIDFCRIGCLELDEHMVRMVSSSRLLVEPVWLLVDDFEGRMYADYIAEHPEYDGVYLRSEVALRLELAAAALDERYRVVVRAGHRPLAIQQRLMTDCLADYQVAYPAVSAEEAAVHVRTFVSDPSTSLPPHCCGAAVDVELFDMKSNQLVDFGGLMNEDREVSFLHYEGIDEAQRENRLRLLRAMVGQGFASTAFEWWHFSFGDQVWAWFYEEEDSLYGLVDVPATVPASGLVVEEKLGAGRVAFDERVAAGTDWVGTVEDASLIEIDNDGELVEHRADGSESVVR